MKIALLYLYPGKNSGQGVFEETFAERLKKQNIQADVFYPSNMELRKIPKIGTVLTMASLREHYNKLLDYDIVYCTDGIGIALLDGELKERILPVYHCSARTQWQQIIVHEDKISELNNYKKYEQELLKIELVAPEITDSSHEAIGLVSVQMAKNAKNIVVVSKRVKQELVDLGANPNIITVINNGIEKHWFEPEIRCRKCDAISKKWSDKPVVMWIGRTGRDRLNFKIKGIDRILEVMDRLDGDKVHKVVIGLVPKEKPRQEKMYGDLFRKHGIEFVANWPYDHLPHLARNGNIFLGTSRYEACQLSLLEAMASGMVPVTYNIGVVPEAIIDNQNGYVIASVEEMTQKVNYLVSHPETMLKFGAEAKKTATEKYQISDMIDKYIGVFKKVSARNEKILDTKSSISSLQDKRVLNLR